MELEERNAGQLQTSDSGPQEVQAVSERYILKKQSYNHANETPQTGRQAKSCYWCGGMHRVEACRFRSEKCRKCGKIGHIRSKKKCRTRESANQVTDRDSDSNSENQVTDLDAESDTNLNGVVST